MTTCTYSTVKGQGTSHLHCPVPAEWTAELDRGGLFYGNQTFPHSGKREVLLPLCMVERFGVYAVMQVMGDGGRFVFSLQYYCTFTRENADGLFLLLLLW